MALPNLVVIGAQKCGTTSLHRDLALHPDIQMSRPKELDFFSGPGSNWDRGLAWYESHFDAASPVRGESSPLYTNFPGWPGTPERMRDMVPDARLVYLVRDPIERIVSHYVHDVAAGSERRSLAALVADPAFEQGVHLRRSRYATQLEQYLRVFPSEQVLVLSQDDLRRDRNAVLAEVFRFVGVDDSVALDEAPELHRSADKRRPRRGLARLVRAAPSLRRFATRPVDRPVVDDATRARLTDLLADDVDRLRHLTGRPFPDWPR